MSVRAVRFVSLFVLATFAAVGCGSDPTEGDEPGDGGPHGGDDAHVGPGADGGGDARSDTGTLPDGATPSDDAGPSGPTEFATSFEANDTKPTWSSTVEVDGTGAKKADGVNGQAATGILGSIMDQVAAVTASGDNPPGEVAANVADGDLQSKWLVFAATGWVQVKLGTAIAVKRYAVSSANDAPERDPKTWTLRGSADG